MLHFVGLIWPQVESNRLCGSCRPSSWEVSKTFWNTAKDKIYSLEPPGTPAVGMHRGMYKSE